MASELELDVSGPMNGAPDSEPTSTTQVLWAVSCCAVCGLAAVSCSTLSPLRNPAVEVGIEHPAGIGLHVTELTLAPPEGLCSAAIVGELMQTLQSRGVTVLSSLSVARDARPGTAVAAEAPVGRSLVLGLNDTVCESDRSSSTRQVQRTRERSRTVDGEEEKYEETYTATEITQTTRFDLGVSGLAVDPATGEVVAARIVERSESDSTAGTLGEYVPEFPSVGSLRTNATAAAVEDIARWLLPWNETAEFVFYDTEECGMNAAYFHLLRGDIGFALDAAVTAIARCDVDAETDSEIRAAAYYNAGMVYFRQGAHEEALVMLRNARTIDPQNAQTTRAEEQVLRAEELQAAVRRVHGGGKGRGEIDLDEDVLIRPPLRDEVNEGR